MFLARCTHRVLGDHGNIVGICAMPFDFFGARGFGDAMQRWYLAACGFFTVLDSTGNLVRMTKEEPARGYFNHDCEGRCTKAGRRVLQHVAG